MNIFLCDPVDDSIKTHFQEKDGFSVESVHEESELKKRVEEAHVWVVRSGTTVDRNLLEAATNLVGIVRAGVGLDNIDLDAAEDQGVRVENTPEASTNAVAELVIGHILSVYRSIPKADRELRKGNWIKKQIDGREIQNKTVGIIGFGRIGQRIGDILTAFGAKILAFDVYLSDEQIEDGGGEPVDLDQLIGESDIISVHVPLNPETRGMIGEQELAQCGDETILINCARGGIIDEEALVEAIDQNRVFGAGLDTFVEEPPASDGVVASPSVVSTPHIGATTREAQQRIAQLVIDKIEDISGS